MTEIHAPERRHDEMLGTSTSAKLERIEFKLDALVRVQEAFAREQETQNLAIRGLQDWRIEMNTYFRQLRWAIMLIGGTFLVTAVNLLLELGKHT